ncbi:Outer membrane receptor proteins, mostly Fe transport [Algoriphagus alkaliphilus]|uniref:Outer membrane receptor proteins, mostly Fe transport n=1 Tax=Algoriphagus alkaliphilus TaxID=279824 RepID=A0A1G5YEW6_9BACT|nr:outer membrane beta-barrel family protein [Algoriphagus alkaliphilus]SDA81093.1 Outer membrane receptor proteins, mostly Fe transport [Algoriphagus alkaliphilus]
MKKNLYPHSLFALIFIFSFDHAIAQKSSSSIKGKVIDFDNKPILFANVALYAAADSSIAKVGFTLDDGSFILPELEIGKYWLKISFVGFKSYVSDPFDLARDADLSWLEIKMEPSDNELDEVVVESQVPLLEIKKDRIVFNVDQSINSLGISALELLRKSPNVFIDNSGNIRIMGRNNAFVAVNGKVLLLTGGDLDAYLRTIQSDQIEAIELITDPGAQYDAIGTAGILNIRLKKNAELGANGSFNAGYSIGNKPRYNTSLSGNYRNKLLNLYGSYGFTRFQDPYIEKVTIQQSDQFVNLVGTGNIDRRIHSLKGGVDLKLSPNSFIGFLALGNFSDALWNVSDRADFGSLPDRVIGGKLWAESNTIMDRTDLSFNLNYRYENEKGTVLNMDADYAYFESLKNNTQPNEIRDPSGETIISSVNFFTDSPVIIDIKSFKLDFERPLGDGILGAGFKFSGVGSDNVFDFYQEVEGELILDPTRSNKFFFQENINAAYLSYTINFSEKFNLATGLRAEQTRSIGDLQNEQGTQSEVVNRDYLDFFPSLNLEYAASKIHNLSISANRRINRPAYQRLNPFQFLLNQLFYAQGNPFLLPEYATAFSLGHSYKNTLSSSFTYSHVKNLLTELYLPGEGDVSIYTYVNLDDQYQYTFNLTAPLTLTEWWESNSSLTAFYIKNKAEISGVSFDENATAFTFSLQNTFTLPKSVYLELTGFYNSPTLWGVNQRLGTIWTIDVGARKSILKGLGSISMSVSDIFKTNVWPSTSDSPIIYVNEFRQDDTRRLLASFTYNFGNRKLKSSRRRVTGLEEEKRRRN